MEVSANAARAGLSSVGVSVSGLTSAVSAFGLEASDVGLVADKFFKTVEVGKLRFEDIASSIGSVAPLASQLGISLDELLAAGSALTLTGQTLSESFTNVQGVMNAVLRPSAEAVNLAEELGVEFSATALQTKGLTRFLKDLEIQVGGDVEVMGQLFGRIEGLRGVLALTGNQAEAFAKNLNAIENAAGATEKAVDIQNQTFQAQVDLLKNQLSNVLRTVGVELLPTVTSSLETLNNVIQDIDWEGFAADIRSTVDALGSLVKLTVDLANAYKTFSSLPGRLNRSAVGKLQQAFPNPDDPLADIQGTGFVPFSQAPASFREGTGRSRYPAAGTRSTPVATQTQTTAPVVTPQPTPLGRALRLSTDEQDLLNSFQPTATLSPGLIAPQRRGVRTGAATPGLMFRA